MLLVIHIIKNENNYFNYILKRVSVEGKFLTDIWIFFGNEISYCPKLFKSAIKSIYIHVLCIHVFYS